MTEETMRRLERIKNHRTAYEAVATDGTKTVRLGFSERKTKGELLRYMGEHGSKILNAFDVPEDVEFTYSAKTGWRLGSLRICWSGTTYRDAVLAGEVGK